MVMIMSHEKKRQDKVTMANVHCVSAGGWPRFISTNGEACAAAPL